MALLSTERKKVEKKQRKQEAWLRVALGKAAHRCQQEHAELILLKMTLVFIRNGNPEKSQLKNNTIAQSVARSPSGN